MTLYQRLPLIGALLLTASLTGCGTNRLNAAFVSKVEAEEDTKTLQLLAQAMALRELPEGPDQCKRMVKTGVVSGDRLDVIALKQDAALTKANGRIVSCADFWAKIKASREGTPLVNPIETK